MNFRSGFAATALLALSTLACAAAPGDNYPNKAIRLVTPFAAGASTDVLSRMISEQMSTDWGQPVVVDNRPGAGGLIGAEMVARSAPDGYTLVNVISSHVAFKNLVKDVKFDALKDFEPVILLARTPLVLVVDNAMPVKTVPEFIAYAREQAKAGKTLTYGTSGIGSAVHLTTELFEQSADVKLEHIPYKGGGAAMADLLGGHIPVVMSGISTVSQSLQVGKLKPIFVTTAKRQPRYPNVPTLAESGYPDVVEDEWWAILAPAGTPKPIVQKLNAEITKIFTKPGMKERLANLEFEFIGGTPEEAAAFMRAKSDRWTKVIQKAGIKAQ